MGVKGTVDCVHADQISAVQLCTDVSPMMPCSSVPKIVEYWAQDIGQSESLLTMAERCDFQERLAFNSSLDRSKLIEDNCSLLKFCIQETFLWQDRPQRFAILGHGTLVPNLTNIFRRDPKILAEQVTKLQNKRKVKWMDEDSQSSKTDDRSLMELHLELDNDSRMQYSGKLITEKSLTKGPPRKLRRKKVPRLDRIDSASFTLVKVLKPKLTASDFVNRMERQDEHRERIKQMTEIIQKLSDLICL
uniref:Uncharacterized protein n=1 Tax=Setaria digitata TaxID=48799 RepID=A0A915PQY1_9BILA